jgi:hypothetical protein
MIGDLLLEGFTAKPHITPRNKSIRIPNLCLRAQTSRRKNAINDI